MFTKLLIGWDLESLETWWSSMIELKIVKTRWIQLRAWWRTYIADHMSRGQLAMLLLNTYLCRMLRCWTDYIVPICMKRLSKFFVDCKFSIGVLYYQHTISCGGLLDFRLDGWILSSLTLCADFSIRPWIVCVPKQWKFIFEINEF